MCALGVESVCLFSGYHQLFNATLLEKVLTLNNWCTTCFSLLKGCSNFFKFLFESFHSLFKLKANPSKLRDKTWKTSLDKDSKRKTRNVLWRYLHSPGMLLTLTNSSRITTCLVTSHLHRFQSLWGRYALFVGKASLCDSKMMCFQVLAQSCILLKIFDVFFSCTKRSYSFKFHNRYIRSKIKYNVKERRDFHSIKNW